MRRHQAIAWAIVDLNLYRPIPSLGHNELNNADVVLYLNSKDIMPLAGILWSKIPRLNDAIFFKIMLCCQDALPRNYHISRISLMYCKKRPLYPKPLLEYTNIHVFHSGNWSTKNSYIMSTLSHTEIFVIGHELFLLCKCFWALCAYV